MKVAVSGGAPIELTDISNAYGFSWERNGAILYGQPDGIWQVSENGGAPVRVIATEAGEQAYGPQLLPGGEWVLFTLANTANSSRWDEANIVIESLSSGERRVLRPGGSDGRYVFAALAEGTYDVTASRGGFLPQTRSGVTVLEGQTTSVDFSLTEDVSLGTLAGGVSDDAGILLVGAAVLVSPGGHARTTDANGLFAVDDLAAGSYAVQVSLAGFETHDESGIVVDAGATTQVDIVLTSLPGPMPGASLIVNGDFSQGLEGWSVWMTGCPKTANCPPGSP